MLQEFYNNETLNQIKLFLSMQKKVYIGTFIDTVREARVSYMCHMSQHIQFSILIYICTVLGQKMRTR